MQRIPAYGVIVLSYVAGGASLLAFCAFCLVGSFFPADPGIRTGEALLIDTGLSLAFFVQHSVMVRIPFRRWLGRRIPEAYLEAVYSIASGVVLLAVIAGWQETRTVFAAAEGPLRLALRILFAAAIAGFAWGVRSLSVFDPFGGRPIAARVRGTTPKSLPLVIRGPYRWVRHPLYLCMLAMIWSHPDLTLDRAWFNVLWTAWIFIGTRLEERDMEAHFGEAYRQYRRKVPMIFPVRIAPSWPKKPS